MSIGYKSVSICDNINFRLHKGSLAAVVGVNGIGKSTLMRTIGNFQPSISGALKIKGEAIVAFNPLKFAKTLSVVLTDPITSNNLRVQELIALGRQPYTNWLGKLAPEDILKVNEAIELLKLSQLKNKKCHELSDGQLQRVLIARAIAQDPDIILLDEPTTHLDLYHKVQILKLLKSIAHQTHKTILFTSHEIEMAIQLCDKILILDGVNNPFEQPCKLIENKAFERLFPSDAVRFDSTTGAFRIQK